MLRLQGSGSDLVTFEPLKTRFPGTRLTPVGVEIPLDSQGPEEILSVCCSERVRILSSVVLNSIDV
ncbi:MAG TPA: hypothetical protein VFU03_03480 [Gemmatimonadales bacterium]|nr:hypothetical protein [Gemmatimonadales bacterium]